MPRVKEHRYACESCIRGHRTDTCDCFDNARQRDLVNKYKEAIDQCANVNSDGIKIALFKKTMKSGRPSTEAAMKQKQQKTYFVLVKVASEGNHCRIAGSFDVDMKSEEVLFPDDQKVRSGPSRSCCTQPGPQPASGSGKRPMLPKQQSSPSSQGNFQFGPILSTNGARQRHQCHCGPSCTCALCPQHPGTESTRRILAETIGQSMPFSQTNSGFQTSMSLPTTQVHGCNGPTSSNAAITGSLQDAFQHVYDLDPNTENLFIAQFNLTDEMGGTVNFPLIPQQPGYDNLHQQLAPQAAIPPLVDEYSENLVLNSEAFQDTAFLANANFDNDIEPPDSTTYSPNFPWAGDG